MYNLYQEIPNFPIGQTGLEDPGLEDPLPEDPKIFLQLPELEVSHLLLEADLRGISSFLLLWY